MEFRLASPQVAVIFLLIAVSVYYIGDVTLNQLFAENPRANKLFHAILLIVTLIIAIGGCLVVLT